MLKNVFMAMAPPCAPLWELPVGGVAASAHCWRMPPLFSAFGLDFRLFRS